jgi:hypothetical protein
MAINLTDLALYQSASKSNVAANNGGRMSNSWVSGSLNEMFPAVPSGERVTGATHWRKMFFKVANDADEAMSDGVVYLYNYTNSTGTRCALATGTQRGMQSTDITTPRLYGVGRVSGAVTGGVTTSLSVVCETGAGADLVFQNGDTIVIDDGTNRDKLTINGAVSWVGDTATITLLAPPVSSYVDQSSVSAAITAATIVGSADNWVETSGAGTYDEATYPILVDSIGGVEQTWTLTFTSASNFTIAGDTLGTVVSSNTFTNVSPTNTAFSKPYFTLYSAGWAGTWAAGNTIVFQTHPAALPFWMRRVVTAGASPLNVDYTYVRFGRI